MKRPMTQLVEAADRVNATVSFTRSDVDYLRTAGRASRDWKVRWTSNPYDRTSTEIVRYGSTLDKAGEELIVALSGVVDIPTN